MGHMWHWVRCGSDCTSLIRTNTVSLSPEIWRSRSVAEAKRNKGMRMSLRKKVFVGGLHTTLQAPLHKQMLCDFKSCMTMKPLSRFEETLGNALIDPFLSWGTLSLTLVFHHHHMVGGLRNPHWTFPRA